MMAFSDDDQQNRVCSLQDIGGHVMKIPLIVFQLMLFMHLEVCSVMRISVLILLDL